jgi:hypothetical protein
MINRRESLKTLAAGGAAAFGATAVRSVPAFALDAPVLVSAFSMTVEGDRTPMTVTMQPGAASCPGSAVPCTGCLAFEAQRMSLEVTALMLTSNPPEDRWGWGADASTALLPANEFTSTAITKSVNPNTGAVLQFSKIRGANNSSLEDAVAGDTLLLTGQAVYRCTYSAGDFVEYTENQALVFTFNGTTWDSSLPPT